MPHNKVRSGAVRAVVARSSASRPAPAPVGPGNAVLDLQRSAGNQAVLAALGHTRAAPPAAVVQRMALTKMLVGRFTALRGKQSHSVRINAKIEEFNGVDKVPWPSASGDAIKRMKGQGNLLRDIQAIIDERTRAEWLDKFAQVNKLEGEIQRERALLQVAGAKMKAEAKGGQGDKAAAVVGQVPFGPSAVKDTSPSKWLERLAGEGIDVPDLTDLQGGGEGKKGAQGTTFTFTTNTGKELMGKVDRSSVKGEVRREFENYKAVYDRVGSHPNLGKVLGWADLRLGEQHAPGLLMEKVAGRDGRTVQVLLRAAWDDGVIKSAEYWGAMQFITRKLVEVVEHLVRAGLVHNDIKPENYMVDETTGQPIVIDLGGAAPIGEQPGAITEEYAAPEMKDAKGKAVMSAKGNEKTDMFGIGATLAHAVEAPDVFHKVAGPAQGVSQAPGGGAFTKGAGGEATKKPFQAGAKTAYTDFLQQTMARDPKDRVDAFAASMGPRSFLRDSLLDDAEAAKVLKGILDGSLRRAWEARWVRAGKEPPKTKERLYKVEMDDKVAQTIKKLGTDEAYTDFAQVQDFGALIERVDEAEVLARKAKSVGTDVHMLEQVIKRLRLKTGSPREAAPSP